MYNEALHVSATIESILKQTHTNWELIVVDDMSLDQSWQIVYEYTLQDSRIKLLKNQKKGIIPALKKAYQHSSGHYITRMDADDLMPARKIATLLTPLLENKRACTVGKVAYFNQINHGKGFQKYANWLNSLVDAQSHYQHIYEECVVPSPCWMMHRTTFDQIGHFNATMYPEDYDLVFRMYQHQVPIISIQDILHFWRDHPNRASRNDPNYLVQNFYPLKLKYFLNIDYSKKTPLILWGAGQSAKNLAKLLIEKGLHFRWISNNSNKIGHVIYNIPIESETILQGIKQHQIIISIKTTSFKEKNQDLFSKLNTRKNVLYFFH